LITLVLYDPHDPHLWYSQWKRDIPFLSQSLHRISWITNKKKIRQYFT